MILNKTIKKVKWISNDLLWGAGLKKLPAPANYFERILIYHGVDQQGNTKINSRFVSVKNIEQHFAYFKSNFHVISIEEYFKNQFKPGKPNICLTFDDGYENNYSLVFPLLKKYEFPATVYVTTVQSMGHEILWPDYFDVATWLDKTSFHFQDDFFYYTKKSGYVSKNTGKSLKNLGRESGTDLKIALMKALPGGKKIKTSGMDMYWKLINKEQLKELSASPLITLGVHGQFHNCLDKIEFSAACKEISESQKYLEEIIQKPVIDFAYPDGTYTTPLVRYAASIGMVRQVSGHRAITKNEEKEFLKNRMGINPHLSNNNQYLAVIKGSY